MTARKPVWVRLAVLLGAALLLLVLFSVEIRSVLTGSHVSRRAVRDETAGPPAAPSDPGWPHRRGPQYNAVSTETDLADFWPPAGPPVLWIRDLGSGYSGLTAVGNRVFTQTQSLTSQMVVCLEADSGATVWQRRCGWPFEPGGIYPGPRATPTWHDGRIYFAGPRGLVGCLDASDGRLIWQLNINKEFDGRGTDFGYACSPTVEDGKVIMPVGGKGASVVALDARDGSTVWSSGDQPASYCSAIPITFCGRRYVVAFLQNALAIFDLSGGRLVWQDEYSQGYDEHAAAPLYEEPYLMVASPFQSGSLCYRLESDGGDPPGIKATTAWSSRQMSNDTASSVLIDGHVYGFDLKDVQSKVHRPSRGKFKCMELATGKVLWESDRTGHATVIAADGKLILFNDKGELLLARASPRQYEELARCEVFSGEICWTAPSLHRGRLYLRSPSKAACIYLGKPEQAAGGQLLAARPTSQIPRSSRFDLTWFVGGEREYAFDPADLPELRRWYWFSLLGVLAVAAIAGAAVDLLVRIKWPERASGAGRATFWSAALVCGVLGTPVYNRLGDHFIFTWPVCLFAAHQLALNAVAAAGRGKSQWRSFLAAVFFLAVCLLYFLACRRLSLAIEWIFLLAFLPCWPIAVPAAYRLCTAGHLLRDFLWAALGFSAFFWAAGGLMLWKTAVF